MLRKNKLFRVIHKCQMDRMHEVECITYGHERLINESKTHGGSTRRPFHL